MGKEFDLFNGKKPVSPVLFPRIPMFDPVDKVQDGRIRIERFKYKDAYVTIDRPFLSAIDQKVLFTLLKTGEFVGETELSFDFVYDFAKVKEIAGLHPATNWKWFEQILKKYQNIWIKFEKKEEKTFKKLRTATLAIVHFQVIEDEKGKSIKFRVSYSKEFMFLLKDFLYLFTVPLSTLKEINEIKNPVIYRLITFFVTQTKSQSWELFHLLGRLTPMKFDTKKKKYRIMKSIKENTKLLQKYGINPVEQQEGKAKTFILNFKKPKSVKVEIGQHVKA